MRESDNDNTMLRMYRQNSIKLMLAWETCCQLLPDPFPHPFEYTNMSDYVCSQL